MSFHPLLLMIAPSEKLVIVSFAVQLSVVGGFFFCSTTFGSVMSVEINFPLVLLYLCLFCLLPDASICCCFRPGHSLGVACVFQLWQLVFCFVNLHQINLKIVIKKSDRFLQACFSRTALATGLFTFKQSTALLASPCTNRLTKASIAASRPSYTRYSTLELRLSCQR